MLAANGRVKPDLVHIHTHEERHIEGAYHIEWREGKKRRRVNAGISVSAIKRMVYRGELKPINLEERDSCSSAPMWRL